MATIATVRVWNTTPHARREIVSTTIPLPAGRFLTSSALTALAAVNPLEDGSDYVLQSLPFGANHDDGSIRYIVVWFEVYMPAGTAVNVGARGNDRYPYPFFYEKVITISDTGGVTVTWAPHARLLTTNNASGLFNASNAIDQTTQSQFVFRFKAKEFLYNYSYVPSERSLAFKPLQSNLNGTTSDATELDTTSVGSGYVRAWLTKIRLTPDHASQGGAPAVVEPPAWAWMITEVYRNNLYPRYWFQYGYNLITADNARRNDGRKQWITNYVKLDVSGPEVLPYYEDHKIPSITRTSSGNSYDNRMELNPTVGIGHTDAAVFSASGLSLDITFPSDHGLDSSTYIQHVRVPTATITSGPSPQGRFIHEGATSIAVVNSRTIRVTNTTRNLGCTGTGSVTACQRMAALIQSKHANVSTGRLAFYYPVGQSPSAIEASTLQALKFELGDHPIHILCQNWPDHQSFGAMKYVRVLPEHYGGDTQRAREDAARIVKTQFDSRKGARDPWHMTIHGAAGRTGIPGAQNDFGASKGGYLARSGCPDLRTAITDLYQDACRMHHYREADCSILNPRSPQYLLNTNVWTSILFYEGTTWVHSSDDPWQHHLGEPLNEAPSEFDCVGYWHNIQNQHWTWNISAIALLLTGDRWGRHAELEDVKNLVLLGKPKDVDYLLGRGYTHSLVGHGGASRSEARYCLMASHIYWLTGDEEIANKFAARIDYTVRTGLNTQDATYDSTKMSGAYVYAFSDGGYNFGLMHVAWMENMVWHLFSASYVLRNVGDTANAIKYETFFDRIARSSTLGTFRRNQYTISYERIAWNIAYYINWEWDSSNFGRFLDENIYPQCWVGLGTGGVGYTSGSPLSSRNLPFANWPTSEFRSWGAGTQLLAWERQGTGSDTALKERLVALLNGPESFIPPVNDYNRVGNDGWGRYWGDNWDDWMSVVENPYISRTSSSSNVNADFINSAITVFEPVVAVGISITADFITITTSIFDPTVSCGMYLYVPWPQEIDFAPTIFEPEVVVPTVSADFIESPFEFDSPTFEAGVLITPDPVISYPSVFEPTIAAGSSVGSVPFDGENNGTLIEVGKIFFDVVFEKYEPTVSIGIDITPDMIASIIDFIPPLVNLTPTASTTVSIGSGTFARRNTIRGVY